MTCPGGNAISGPPLRTPGVLAVLRCCHSGRPPHAAMANTTDQHVQTMLAAASTHPSLKCSAIIMWFNEVSHSPVIIFTQRCMDLTDPIAWSAFWRFAFCHWCHRSCPVARTPRWMRKIREVTETQQLQDASVWRCFVNTCTWGKHHCRSTSRAWTHITMDGNDSHEYLNKQKMQSCILCYMYNCVYNHIYLRKHILANVKRFGCAEARTSTQDIFLLQSKQLHFIALSLSLFTTLRPLHFAPLRPLESNLWVRILVLRPCKRATE